MTSYIAKPFLKWAGGKGKLITEISHKIPFSKTHNMTYIEPFVGSGAMLFWILANFPNLKRVIINDLNQDLVITYSAIQHNVEHIIAILNTWQNEYQQTEELPEDRKQYYYEKRTLFNQRNTDEAHRAALFIFLNRTCFNGLYRVNKSNHFNVPMGSYKNPTICDERNLRAVCDALQGVEILNGDFENTIKYASIDSFYYLDPPYKPISDTANFTAYSQEVFDDKQQIRLKLFCDKLAQNNAKWVLSNSDVRSTNNNDSFFDDLYKDYRINRVLTTRSIHADASKRGQTSELLIGNYL